MAATAHLCPLPRPYDLRDYRIPFDSLAHRSYRSFVGICEL